METCEFSLVYFFYKRNSALLARSPPFFSRQLPLPLAKLLPRSYLYDRLESKKRKDENKFTTTYICGNSLEISVITLIRIIRVGRSQAIYQSTLKYRLEDNFDVTLCKLVRNKILSKFVSVITLITIIRVISGIH